MHDNNGQIYQINITMNKISQLKKQATPTKQPKQGWKQLLNNSQIFHKNIPQFPQVKACQLRMTYSKLQPHKNYSLQSKLSKLKKTRGSFLLQKQARNKQQQNQNDIKKLTIFNFNPRANQRAKVDTNQFSHTIDVSQINRINQQKKKPIHDIARISQMRKSQQFSDYFKKIIISQKANINIDLTKLCSQGKCVSITDRTHFQRLQRIKWSLMNRKIQQKSFHCASKKISHHQMENPLFWQLPQLQLSKIKKKKKQKNEKLELKRLNKQRYQAQANLSIKNSSTFVCDPWQSDPIYNDEQDQ